MKWYLISMNADGSISYLAQGTEKEMRSLCRFSIYAVTTISDYKLAQSIFGKNRWQEEMSTELLSSLTIGLE